MASASLYEIAITQRRELPEYVPVHHRLLRWTRPRFGAFVAWVRRQLGLPPNAQHATVHAASAVAGGGHITATATAQNPWPTTLEDRVARLETGLAELRTRQSADTEGLSRRVTAVQQRVVKTADELRDALSDMETKRRDSLRESPFWKRLGIAIFIVGLFISTWGSLCSA